MSPANRKHFPNTEEGIALLSMADVLNPQLGDSLEEKETTNVENVCQCSYRFLILTDRNRRLRVVIILKILGDVN